MELKENETDCPIHGKQLTLSFHSGADGIADPEWSRKWCFACVAQIINDQIALLLWRHNQEQEGKKAEFVENSSPQDARVALLGDLQGTGCTRLDGQDM